MRQQTLIRLDAEQVRVHEPGFGVGWKDLHNDPANPSFR